MIKSLKLLEARTVCAYIYACVYMYVYICIYMWVLIPKTSTSLWKESLEINSSKKSYRCSSPLTLRPTYAGSANKHTHNVIFIDYEQNEQGNHPPFITPRQPATRNADKNFDQSLGLITLGKTMVKARTQIFYLLHGKQTKATLFDDREEKHNHKTNREKLLIQKNKLTEKCFSEKALCLSLNSYSFKGLMLVFHSITSLSKNILTVCHMKSL